MMDATAQHNAQSKAQTVEAAPATGKGRDDGAAAVLPAGTHAPPFTLHSTPDQTVSLSDFHGRPVVLAFYPADWSPVCGDQISLYNEMREDFAEYGAQVLGISVDGAWCHAAFAEHRKIRFPLLSDFHPKGLVARSYGAYDDQAGIAERALFVIDGLGIIRWSYLSPIGVNPGADGIFRALDGLMSGDRPVENASSERSRDDNTRTRPTATERAAESRSETSAR